MYAWTNEYDNRSYVALVDDEELTDIDILDITDPYAPVLVNDILSLWPCSASTRRYRGT